MRFLLKANMPVEVGNAAAKAGKLAGTIHAILAELKPAAVSCTADHGHRTAFIVLHLHDASQLPAMAEPWCLAFNASVEMHPVMVPEELLKADPAIAQAVKQYS